MSVCFFKHGVCTVQCKYCESGRCYLGAELHDFSSQEVRDTLIVSSSSHQSIAHNSTSDQSQPRRCVLTWK